MLVSVFSYHLYQDGLVVGTEPLHPFHNGNSMTPRGIPWMAPRNYVDDYSQLPEGDWRPGHFIHEFTHVLQNQQGNYNYLDFVELWVGHWFDYRATYEVDRTMLGQPLWLFNMEQQAVIVQSVYMGYYTGDDLVRAQQTIEGFQTQPPRPTLPPPWYNK